MKRKNNNKKLTLLLILVLLISVGYAALASNLKINGTSGVKANTWSVYWDNVQITNGSVPADNDHKARITDAAKTQVEFSVELSEPGDFYEFTVDAVNNGTIDAMIASHGIVDGVYSDANYQNEVETLPDALSYTVTYADGSEIQEKHLLAKKTNGVPTTETYKVRIEYRNDDSINPEDLDNNNDQTYYFKFSVEYVQADNTAIDRNYKAIRRGYTQNAGQITPGDVIEIGETEDFYVISSNSEKTVLLAKYNLLVGNEAADSSAPVTPISTSTPGYGLQSVDAVGYSGPSYYSVLAFSETNYWHGGGLLSPYNANGVSYSGNPYPYVYDSNSNLYQYINGENGYVSKLIGMGAPSTITGRLLTYEEAVSSQNIEYNGSSIILDLSFSLGSAYDRYSIWAVNPFGNLTYIHYDSIIDFCVRPVIEIPTSELN